MEKNKLNKILRTGTAVLLAGALCGCSVQFGTNKEPKLDPNEPKLDMVVAHATKGENSDEMKITYEEFRKEYKYYLVNTNIDDDTDEQVANACKSQREKVINYLINEQIILQKAKEMDLYDLTEEEQKAVDEEFDSKIAEQVKYFGEKAEQELSGQSTGGTVESESDEQSSETESQPVMTDEEKEARGNEELDLMLQKCGMTRDDLHWWAQSSKITEKLRAELAKNVTYADAEEEFIGAQNKAKELYNSDIEQYQQQGYDQIWLPEGSRYIKHVLLGFDNDVKSEITKLRTDGKDEEADKLRTEKAEELKSKQEEVEKKLDDGEDISKLITEYSSDATSSLMYPDGYTVIPNSTTYMPEFQDAAFIPQKIGDRTACVTDYGVHIMVYAGDAKISDELKKNFTDYVFEQLKLREYALKMAEWAEEYDFEIDYEALRIDAPVEEQSSSAASDESSDISSETNSDVSNIANSETSSETGSDVSSGTSSEASSEISSDGSN